MSRAREHWIRSGIGSGVRQGLSPDPSPETRSDPMIEPSLEGFCLPHTTRGLPVMPIHRAESVRESSFPGEMVSARIQPEQVVPTLQSRGQGTASELVEGHACRAVHRGGSAGKESR